MKETGKEKSLEELRTYALEVIKIARLAGEAILEVYQAGSDIGLSSKSDQSPLTLADKAANGIICEGLEKLYPEIPIISEENKSVPYEKRKSFEYYWLVDPLDGTKEFIKRNGEFTVNIALIHRQKSVLGIVFAPVFGDMYWGGRGLGAFVQSGAREKRLEAAKFKMDDPGLGLVCSRSHMNDSTREFVDALVEPELVSKGSSLKFLILASGDAHLYPRLAPTMEWDTAAAQIILEEAGGKVLQAGTGEPLIYNKEDLLNPHFVAYGRVERIG